MPHRQRAFPCGIIRAPLDDRHLRGQAAAAGERLVKVCRRWGDVPKVPREAARCIMIVNNSGPTRSKRPNPRVLGRLHSRL
jgi:hypothetical protein